MEIFGLEEFGVNESELEGELSKTDFEFSIHLKYYPEIDKLKPLTPKQRRLIICQFLRDGFKQLKEKYPRKDYELIGTRTKPRGLKGRLNGEKLSHFSQESIAERIFINNVEGRKKITKQKKSFFYSVQALFAAKVEGFDYKSSIRLTEERILLVKALDSKNAEEKAMLEFNEYAKSENINGDYRFAKWEFIEIIDVYETDVQEIDPNGTEVFSIWKNRKVKS